MKFVSYKTQEGKILQLLRERREKGVFVYEMTTPRPQGLGIAQYNARIYGLRKKGFVIDNAEPGHFVLKYDTQPKVLFDYDNATATVRLI